MTTYVQPPLPGSFSSRAVNCVLSLLIPPPLLGCALDDLQAVAVRGTPSIRNAALRKSTPQNFGSFKPKIGAAEAEALSPLKDGSLFDSTNLGKSKSFTKVSSHIMDDALSQITWTLDPNTDFRIAQVRVYQP